MRFWGGFRTRSAVRVVICRAAICALILGCAGSFSTAAARVRPAGDTSIAQSLPSDYIANYGHRAKSCHGLITPPWVSWLSYANVTVTDEWRVYASSAALCKLARGTADAVIFDAPFHDGAGGALTPMLAFALHHHSASLADAPRPAGRSWACGVLPSFWGQSAWDLARLAKHTGAPQPSDFAAASGPAAGAGYCERGAKLDSTAKWKGGKFFSWSPDTLSCQRRYKLKDVPDPNNPGETTNPPFPAALFGDYDAVGC